jgi:hypothetical protein
MYIFSTIITQFKTNPAEWTTTLLLLLTLFVTIYLESKSIKLTYTIDKRGAGRKGFWIDATNTSNRRSINIVAFGIKKWNGEIREEKHKSVVIGEQLKPQGQEDFTFYDSENGNFIPVEANDIYYAYIKDSTGKIYKKYSHGMLFSPLKYLFVRLRK